MIPDGGAPTDLEIRPVGRADYEAAWRVLVELRTDVGRSGFAAELERLARAHRYQLIGAFEQGRLVGLAGVREVRTFARGSHLHVDDLVVAAQARGRGVGRRLLAHVEALARRRGLRQVFLDSRPGALGFYEREGYRQHDSILVRKRLDEPP